jgi:hypothetical protein
MMFRPPMGPMGSLVLAPGLMLLEGDSNRYLEYSFFHTNYAPSWYVLQCSMLNYNFILYLCLF